MFITPAYAQAAGAPAGAGDFIGMILPLVLIMGVFYFLLIRPQQRKMKEHQEMLKKVGKGDTIVTTGGLIGRGLRAGGGLQGQDGKNRRCGDQQAGGHPGKALNGHCRRS